MGYQQQRVLEQNHQYTFLVRKAYQLATFYYHAKQHQYLYVHTNISIVACQIDCGCCASPKQNEGGGIMIYW